MNARSLTQDNIIHWLLVLTMAFATANAVVSGGKIFFIPVLLLCFWLWIRFATKHPAAALIIVVFFAEQCFDITTFGIRQRLLSDIGIALMLPLIALNFQRVWQHVTVRRSPYAIGILLFFGAIIISLYFGSHLKFGQPMAVGLTVARKYLLFCSYFFLVAVGATSEDCFRFMKYLAWLGGVIAFLSIVDVALGGGIVFPYYHAIGQERAGQLRIHVGTFLIVFSIIYSFVKSQNLPKSSEKRIVYIILLGVGLFTIGFIVMTRAIILGLMVTFIFWLIRKVTNQKIMLVCAIVSIVAIIFLSGLGKIVFSDTFVGKIMKETSTELVSDKGNISVRKNGAKFYLDLMLQNTPLTGVGRFSNTNYPNNPVTIAGALNHYFIIDVNGIATIVFFGLLGLLLLTYFIIKSLRDTLVVIKHGQSSEKYNFEILLFIFIYTLATPTLNNIIVERMLVYSGVFFYLLSLSNDKLMFITLRRNHNG